MRRYSLSYNNINPNFLIDTERCTDIIDEPYQSFLSICENILNRNVNVKPSLSLSSKYSDYYRHDSSIYSQSFTIKPSWTKTIKGGNESNPALHFYKKALPLILNEIFNDNGETIYRSFLPECDFDKIIKGTESDFAVDFYSPLLKLVIEIDGNQHSTGKQKLKDIERDRLLTGRGVKICRLTTSDIKIGRYDYLISMLKNIDVNNELKRLVDFKTLNQSDIDLMYIIRIQIAIIALLRSGKIDLSDKQWNLRLVAHENVSNDVIMIAWSDLRTLMYHISILMGLDIDFPKISSNDPAITMDISVGNNYSEPTNKCDVYIRNDYFFYDQDSDNNDRYASYKNYYSVSEGSFHYNIKAYEESLNHWIVDDKQHRSLLFILKYCFGFDEFRRNQESIIVNCLNGQSVIGVLPTSAGKSLCYQMCALLLPGSTLVVSPLKSLMEDQYNSLCEYGIGNTAFISGDNIMTKQETVFNNRSLITLVSPERFFNVNFIKYITANSSRYRMVVIDEAHCISEWGHDFRTSYLCLFYSLKRLFSKNLCLIGLTATASPNVCEDVIAEFNTFRNNTLLITADSLCRDELVLHPISFNNMVKKADWLDSFIKNNEFLEDKTVVFTKFVDSRDDVSSCIPLCKKYRRKMGSNDTVLVSYFCSENKSEPLERDNGTKLIDFKNGDTRLLFATKAFGMGINIPDIRNTIHYGLSGSIESTYQEIGRAGRDGKKSDCYILYEKELPENIKRFERNDISIDEFDRCRGDYSELKGNLFFLINSNKDPDKESIFIHSFLKYIKDRHSFSLNDAIRELKNDGKITTITKVDIDKALYRLLTLGLIKMWSMIYSEDLDNPIYSSICYNDISIEEGIQNLESYIHRYDCSYIYPGKKNYKSLIEELLKWNFDNFIRNRITSLGLLYEYCNSHSDSKSLMDAFTDFLTVDPGLKIVLNNNDPDEWFSYIDKVPAKSRKHKTDRYLESYHNDKALNFISAITNIQISDDYSEDSSPITNLSKSLEKMTDLPMDDKKKIVTRTYELLVDKERITATVPIFLRWMPECARLILDITDDEAAKIFVLSEYNNRLKEIVGLINDKV